MNGHQSFALFRAGERFRTVGGKGLMFDWLQVRVYAIGGGSSFHCMVGMGRVDGMWMAKLAVLQLRPMDCDDDAERR